MLQLSTAGGRLIISSDGVWDALSPEMAFDCCRGMPADAAATQVVKVCNEQLFSIYLATFSKIIFLKQILKIIFQNFVWKLNSKNKFSQCIHCEGTLLLYIMQCSRPILRTVLEKHLKTS